MLAELGERQHGRVGAGRSTRSANRAEITHRLQTGHIHEVTRGVYAIGQAKWTRLGQLMASVLAGGPGALLGGWSSAAITGVLPHRDAVHIVTPNKRRNRDGIIFHRSEVPPDERDVAEDIPCTSISRTLLDVAAHHGPNAFGRAAREAEFRRLTDTVGLPGLCQRYPGRRGVGIAREALKAGIPAAHHRSELEIIFSDLLVAERLPQPAVNTLIHVPGESFEVDISWPGERLVVELDGREGHDTDSAFEEDRRRDRILQKAGWRVIRFTWNDLTLRPQQSTAELCHFLGQSRI